LEGIETAFLKLAGEAAFEGPFLGVELLGLVPWYRRWLGEFKVTSKNAIVKLIRIEQAQPWVEVSGQGKLERVVLIFAAILWTLGLSNRS
jgi:hypothetical protein